MSSPAKVRVPLSISNRMQPNENTSVRASTLRPRACSGDMYAAVPRITPSCVAWYVNVGDWLRCTSARDEEDASEAVGLASPKSSTLTWPSGVSRTFAGFRSRWTTPFRCAASSARAIWSAMPSPSSSGSAPASMRRVRSSPGTSSMTSALRPPASSIP